MCGILGLAGLSESAFDTRLARLAWRGRDDRRQLELGGLRLGCQRLAITDAHAAQPLVIGEAGARVAIVFNGNLADAASWRRRLAAQGEAPQTCNDAELPLRLWRAAGLAGLRQLEGQFAFALVDEGLGQLVLGRDTFGEKPLLMRPSAHAWPAFASSASALFEQDPPQLPVRALARFLLRGWLGPEDLPPGIESLPPNTIRVYGREGEEDPPAPRDVLLRDASAPASYPGPNHEKGMDLEELLLRAVARRLDADREIALFLSGGLDSTAIAVALHELGWRVRCYSADFADGRQEGERAERVAQALGFPCRRVTIGPEVLDELPGLLAMHGLPFGDASVLALYALSRAAREDGVGVALLGDGGDELFGGYRRQRAWRWAHALAPWARPWLTPFAGRAHGEAGRFARAAVRGDYAAMWEQARPRDVARLLGLNALPAGDAAPTWTSRLNAGTTADLAVYLPEDLCVKADLATLAAGIEGRAPLLDVSLAAALRGRASAGGEVASKMALRAFVSRRLPAPLREGRKHGFGLPLARWLASSSFLDRAWSRLGPGSALHAGLLQRWTHELRSGDRRRAPLLWHAAALACAPRSSGLYQVEAGRHTPSPS